jgi:mannobiose 2-epimerase
MRAFARELLRNELETELWRNLSLWFPRSVDREYGGFLCDFDYRWDPSGRQPKLLEYQARQTLAAARGAAHAADLKFLRESAMHGFRYLKERMWDAELGGWYRFLDRIGIPGEGATKHGHGTSYAISACVACHELTGDPDCLDLAKSAFHWLEVNAHDREHGGYFVFYRRNGTPILSWDEASNPGKTRDGIGTPIGFKDVNTTCDLLACFGDLYRLWHDRLLRMRLDELLGIVRDRFVVAPGVIHYYTHPDWTPVPDFVRYGQVLRSANLLISASEALHGSVDPTTEDIVRSMVDTMLRVAWDPEKGRFYLAGSSFGATSTDDALIFVNDKRWWPQAEGMIALLTMARSFPDTPIYLTNFVRLWEYIKTYMIDAAHGGWLASGLDTKPEGSDEPKATMWKDASHEVVALLKSISLVDAVQLSMPPLS